MRRMSRAREIGTVATALLGPRVLRVPVLCALALGGCASASGGGSGGGSGSGGSGGSGDSGTQSLSGNWMLASASDARGAMELSGVTITLKIDGVKANGNAPCNAYGEMLSSSTTGPIRLKRSITTTMACMPSDRNVLEARYFAVLGDVTRAAITGGNLVLTGPGDTLEFSRAAQ